MDECGNDFTWTPEPRKPVTAILSHPVHGRLVEKIILMITTLICLKGSFSTLSWRDGEVAFSMPAVGEAMGPACCV